MLIWFPLLLNAFLFLQAHVWIARGSPTSIAHTNNVESMEMEYPSKETGAPREFELRAYFKRILSSSTSLKQGCIGIISGIYEQEESELKYRPEYEVCSLLLRVRSQEVLHLKIFERDELDLFRALLEMLKAIPSKEFDLSSYLQSVFHFSIICGSTAVFHFVLHSGFVRVNGIASETFDNWQSPTGVEDERRYFELRFEQAQPSMTMRPLTIAILREQKHMVEQLLEMGANPSVTDPYFSRILHHPLTLAAVFNSNADILQLLLQRQEYSEAIIGHALLTATVVENWSSFLLLLGKQWLPPSILNMAARIAVRSSNCLFIQKLEEFGADLHHENDILLSIACKYRNISVVKYLIKEKHFDPNDQRALKAAALSGDEEIVLYLLDSGASVSPDLVEEANAHGLRKMATLLDYFTDEVKLWNEWKLFLLAITKGDHKTVLNYIKHPLCIKLIHLNEDAALASAFDLRQKLIAEILIIAGANVNAQDAYPLRRAVQDGDLTAVKMLLQHGAEPNVRNGWCLKTAIYEQRTDLVRILLEAGAQVNEHMVALAIKTGIYDIAVLVASRYPHLLEKGASMMDLAIWTGSKNIFSFFRNRNIDPRGTSVEYNLIRAVSNHHIEVASMVLSCVLHDTTSNISEDENVLIYKPRSWVAVENDLMHYENDASFSIKFAEHMVHALHQRILSPPVTLVLATLMNMPQLIQTLALNDDVDVKKDGEASLIIASHRGYIEIVHLLITLGVDIHTKLSETLYEQCSGDNFAFHPQQNEGELNFIMNAPFAVARQRNNIIIVDYLEKLISKL